MNNDYKIRLQAMIDDSSLADVQKKLAKERLKIGADIVLDQFGKNKAEIEKQSKALSNMIKGTLGDAVPDKLAAQWAKQFYKEIEAGAKKAAGEQEKLNENVSDQSLSQVFNKFKNSKIGSSAINELWNQLKKIPEEVYKIDTAMTTLYRVTDETDWKYSQFLDQAASKAQGLGRSISGLIDQTAAWAGLGFSLDEADKLAEISSVYANIGNVDDQTAISELAAAMKAFNIEASDSISIVDQLNALGSEYSISAADLGDGLRKSADAMALANNDIEQTLAMIAGGAEITRDAGGMGNSLKVLALRLRGMKEELEAFGEDASDVLPVDKLQSRISEYTKGAVNIFDDFDPSKLKSTYDILLSISRVWNDISATDQAELLDVIAGKQDAGNVSALLKAFQKGQVQQAYGDALNSDGYAMQEQARWLDSLEAKTQQLEAAFQSLSNTVLGSDVLKVLADGGIALLNILDKLVDGFGLLPTLVSGGAITAFIKNFDWLCNKSCLKIA